MANVTSEGILLPITAQITNLREIANQLKKFSDTNILGNSFSGKAINTELSKVMRSLEQLEVRSKNAFKTDADFSAVEKEANKIELSMQRIQDTIRKVPFKDLQIPDNVTAEIKNLEAGIKALEVSMNAFKSKQKQGLLGNISFTEDLNKAFDSKQTVSILQKDYDGIYKAISDGMKKINTELQTQQNQFKKYSQLVSNDTQGKESSSLFGAIEWLQKGFQPLSKNPDKYNEQQKMLAQYMNINEEGTGFQGFKRGLASDKFYEDLAKRFEISPTQIEEIRKRISDSGKTLKKTVVQTLQSIVNSPEESAKIFTGGKLDYATLTTQATSFNENSKIMNDADTNVKDLESRFTAATAALKEYSKTSSDVEKRQKALEAALAGPRTALESLKLAVQQNVQIAPELASTYQKCNAKLAQLRSTVQKNQTELTRLDTAMSKLQGISNYVNRYIGIYAIMRRVTTAIRNAFNNIKDLDKSITNIAVVTNMTQQDLWGKIGEYTTMAQQYGVATKDVYTVSQLFYQQGLQTSQVMSLTTETLKMAKIAGMDYSDAANAMTVAIRAFKIEMSEAQQVTDTYSALAAKFAVSSAEIASAMEKTASSAANVGMSIQSTSAFISVMVQTTRESAENIGSALKSIISRYGEMKASPNTLLNIDGEEVAFNKVDTALASVGISIKDASGQFRDFDDVILELAAKWDTLDNNTQRYIATIMA